MSQPFCRYLHPFEPGLRPSLEPEVQRAILAAWASDRPASSGWATTPPAPAPRRIASIDAPPDTCRPTVDRGSAAGAGP